MNTQIESHQEKTSSDVRVQATAKIWVFSIAIMGVAIPITAITGSVLIPALVAISPALATAAVWYFGAQSHNIPTPSSADNRAERVGAQRIAELEERLANLETIDNFERRLAEESLKRDNDKTDLAKHIQPQLETQ